MQIESYTVGMVQTNCYLVINEETNETLIIDPGASGIRLAEKIKEKNLVPKAILYTHGHCDHTDGTEKLIESMGEKIPVYALDEERIVLENDRYHMASQMGMGVKNYYADEYLKDGQECTIAGMNFKVLATPGHTPGGCCYYFKDENVVFSGDTLFADSIGRTDFPGGSLETLLNSIRTKLFVLPDDTVVLSGHMGPTDIGHEKKFNPFL